MYIENINKNISLYQYKKRKDKIIEFQNRMQNTKEQNKKQNGIKIYRIEYKKCLKVLENNIF